MLESRLEETISTMEAPVPPRHPPVVLDHVGVNLHAASRTGAAARRRTMVQSGPESMRRRYRRDRVSREVKDISRMASMIGWRRTR